MSAVLEPITTSDVEAIAAEGKAAGEIGLDTEFMRERTYRARLCLVQISTPDSIYIVDPLEVEDLSPLASLIGDPGIEVVVHAGRQDLEIFFERYDVVPARIYDIQLAAAFAGLGASLPYGRLVEELTGTKLKKGESYSDWCRRPLSGEQMTYAADDVRYLLPAARELKTRLVAQGRDTWVVEELAALENREAFEMNLDEAYMRVGGRGSLSGRQMSVLREMAKWRESEAQRRDVPRGWIVKDPTLIEIARRSPTTIGALSKIRGLNAREAERYGKGMLAAIEKGAGGEEIRSPKAPPRGAQVRARVLSGPCDAIVRSRCEAANIATELVSTRGELEALLADISAGVSDLSRHRMMRGWRRELAGDHVVAFARGDVTLRATEHAPYIEEVAR